MPTGYTAKLCKQEVDFSEFVMTCAKAMGACVMMRDDPLDAPLPERFEPYSYHAEKLKESQELLAQATALSTETCATRAQGDYAQELESAQQRIAEALATRDRLKAMKAKVVQWDAPTAEHEGLKEFMLDQINRTIDLDGDASYYQGRIKELRQLSAEEWRQRAIGKALEDIDYHAAKHRKEVEHTEARNEWIKSLRESLARAGAKESSNEN